MPQVNHRACPVDPAAPAGGNGPGSTTAYPRHAEVESEGWFWGAVHSVEHAASYAYHEGEEAVHFAEDTAYRVANVARAIYLSIEYSHQTIKDRLRMDIDELKAAFIPGLLIALGIVAVSTFAGATVAGLIAGVVTGGAAAVPAAIAGGEFGFSVGLDILDMLGILFLVKNIAESIPRIFQLVEHAAKIAWNAGYVPNHPAITDVEKAAHGLAEASAELVNVVIQGILLWILSESTAARTGQLLKGVENIKDPAALAARGRELMAQINAKGGPINAALDAAVAELVGLLRKGKGLTKGLADFVAKKYRQIIDSIITDDRIPAPEPKGQGTPPQQAPPQKPISEQSTARKGVFGEARSDEYMTKNGYKKLNGDPVQDTDAPTGPGIDGVWENSNPPPQYVVSESKYGSSRLSTLADGTKQMSPEWINDRLPAEVGDDTADDIKAAGYQRWLLQVDDQGNVTRTVLQPGKP